MRGIHRRHPITKISATYQGHDVTGTYNASNTSGKGQKPEKALNAPVGTMCCGSEGSTKNNKQGCEHQSSLTTDTVANQTNEDLPDDSTYIEL